MKAEEKEKERLKCRQLTSLEKTDRRQCFPTHLGSRSSLGYFVYFEQMLQIAVLQIKTQSFH